MSALPLPRPVNVGDAISVVAPSGPFDVDSFDRGLQRLSSHFRIVLHGDIKARTGYLAGTDARRRDELLAAVRDPDTVAIIAARGGFGATRLLPGLRDHHEDIRAANKLLVGFSDITALQSLWSELGVRSLHAPMVAWLGRHPSPQAAAPPHDATETRLLAEAIRAASRGVLSQHLPAAALSRRADPAATSAPLAGGNLAVLAALFGTPYQPRWRDHIVFLEDVGERPYRIDRMLTTLRQAGAFDGVAGVALGAFTACAPGKDGVSVDDVLRDHFGDAPYPVLMALEAGHIDAYFAMPFGARATFEEASLRFGEGSS